MNTLASYILIEWKLLFRGRLMWVMLVLIGGLFYLTTTNNFFSGDMGWYTVSVSTFFIPLTILLAQFLTIHTARREQVLKVAPLIGTLPYRSWQWIAARLAALSIPFSVVALMPALFYVYQAARLGVAWSSLTTGVLMLASFVIPMLFAIVFSYALGTWIRGRIVYLIGFASILTLLVFGRRLLVYFLPMHWTHGIDIALSDLKTFGYYSELWGFSEDVTYWWHRLFFALFTVFLSGLLIHRAMRRRKERQGVWMLYPICGAALAAMALCVYSYTAAWNERMDQHEQNLKFYSEVLQTENPMGMNRLVIEQFLGIADHGLLGMDELDAGDLNFDEDQEDPGPLNRRMFMPRYNPLTEKHKQDLLLGQYYAVLTATDYDLNVTLEDDHGITIDGVIRMRHDGDEPFERWPMSLRHLFEITSVQVNRQAARFEWEPYQDVFWVIPAEPIAPHSELELYIAYHGKVDDWRYRIAYEPGHNYWERRAFVDDDRLFLPGFYGWYPYPGNQRIAELERYYVSSGTRSYETIHIVESEPVRAPADFHVKVEANTSMQIVANGEISDRRSEGKRQIVTIQARDVRGFSLLGGDITGWSAADDHAEISVVLSNQIPPAYAETLVEKMLTNYVKLTNLASQLEPATYAPEKLYIVRADYPGKMDHSSRVSESRRPNLIDRNGFVFLSRITNPASILSGLASMLEYDQDVLRGTLFARGELSYSDYMFVMTETMSYYIQRDETKDADKPLITASYRRWYDVMNDIYDRYGAEGFPEALGEIYEYLRTQEPWGRSYNEVESDLLNFLRQLAGGARP